jgi:hypothetical protein
VEQLEGVGVVVAVELWMGSKYFKNEELIWYK